MAITVRCLRCRAELEEPGGLLFSSPSSRLAQHGDDLEWTVTKDHLCATCYPLVKKWIEAGDQRLVALLSLLDRAFMEGRTVMPEATDDEARIIEWFAEKCLEVSP